MKSGFKLLWRIALLILLVVLIVIAVANNDPVTIRLLPAQFAGVVQYEFETHLFMIIFAAMIVGFVLGYVLEYLRETKHRGAKNRLSRETRKLEAEVATLKEKAGIEEDDILALLK